MPNRIDVLRIVLASVNAAYAARGRRPVEIGEETALLASSGGELDSLSIVMLMTDLEQRIGQNGYSAGALTERLLDEETAFSTVGALTDFVHGHLSSQP